MEYELLQQRKPNGKKKAITVNTVMSLAMASQNPVFKTMEFHDALKDFRRYGLRTPNNIEFNLERELFWITRTLFENCITTAEVELLLL